MTVLEHAKAGGHSVVECTAEADREGEWVGWCDSLFPDSVWAQCDSWYNKRAHGERDAL